MTAQPRTLSPAEEMRIFLGLLVQPFVAAGLGFVAYPLVDLHGGRAADSTDAAVALAAGSGLAAFFLSFLAALVAVWVIRRHPLTLPRALVSGVLLGNVPTVLGVLAGGVDGWAGFVRVVLFASFLGLGGAAAFWVVWMISRPAPDIETTPSA